MTYETLAIGAITAGYLIVNKILNEKRRKTIDNFITNVNKNLISKGIVSNKKQENLFKKIDKYSLIS